MEYQIHINPLPVGRNEENGLTTCMLIYQYASKAINYFEELRNSIKHRRYNYNEWKLSSTIKGSK